MSDYLCSDSELNSIANAIKTPAGITGKLVFPNGFISAANQLVKPTGTKNITISSAGTTTEDVTTYASAAITVKAGTAGTPSATKSISGQIATITPSVTNTTGYITGGTKTGTAKTVTASELVSGTLNISQNGTVDVTNYRYVDVNVSGGGGGSWTDITSEFDPLSDGFPADTFYAATNGTYVVIQAAALWVNSYETYQLNLPSNYYPDQNYMAYMGMMFDPYGNGWVDCWCDPYSFIVSASPNWDGEALFSLTYKVAPPGE